MCTTKTLDFLTPETLALIVLIQESSSDPDPSSSLTTLILVHFFAIFFIKSFNKKSGFIQKKTAKISWLFSKFFTIFSKIRSSRKFKGNSTLFHK